MKEIQNENDRKKLLSIQNVLVPHVTASKPMAAWKLASVNIVCPPQYYFQVCFLALLHQASQHLELTVISTCYPIIIMCCKGRFSDKI